MISRLIINLQNPALYDPSSRMRHEGRTTDTDTNIGPFVTTILDRDASLQTNALLSIIMNDSTNDEESAVDGGVDGKVPGWNINLCENGARRVGDQSSQYFDRGGCLIVPFTLFWGRRIILALNYAGIELTTILHWWTSKRSPKSADHPSNFNRFPDSHLDEENFHRPWPYLWVDN